MNTGTATLTGVCHTKMHYGRLKIKTFEADKIIHNGGVVEAIKGCDGYLVPGGFGERGWEGKILTTKYSREHEIPHFGICLGVQVMAVEFARHVLGIKDANSTEIDPDTKDRVISLLSKQQNVQDVGGTMRQVFTGTTKNEQDKRR